MGGVYQDYQDHGWGSFSEVKDNEEKSFILLPPDADSSCHDAIAKDAFIGAFGNKELTIHVMEREPKSLEEAFKIAERMELYARKVKPEGKDGFDSKLRDLVDPGNLFQVYCDS